MQNAVVNLELKIVAISLFEMLEWSRHIINMLLYEYGEILTHWLTRVNISPYEYNNL